MDGSGPSRPMPRSYAAPSRTEAVVPAPQRPHPSQIKRNSLSGRAFHNSTKHHHHRHHVRDTAQSAAELKPPISLDHLLWRDRKSPDISTAQQHQRDVDEWRERQAYAERAERRRITPEQIEKARRANVHREEKLRESLKTVEDAGMASTRQLDDTYYAILEKASILRSTVASLQELAEESRRMHLQFGEDATQLEMDTKRTLESFGDFERPQREIDKLVVRLDTSKTQTRVLNERLEAARNRVEAYEKRDDAKQSMRRTQWRATSGVLLSLAFVIIALILVKTRDDLGERMINLGDAVGKIVPPALRSTPCPSEDPYLSNLFDNL